MVIKLIDHYCCSRFDLFIRLSPRKIGCQPFLYLCENGVIKLFDLYCFQLAYRVFQKSARAVMSM